MRKKVITKNIKIANECQRDEKIIEDFENAKGKYRYSFPISGFLG